MADSNRNLHARIEDGEVHLQVRIIHPMETGLRTDKNTRQKVPAHFIQEVTVARNGEVVAMVSMGAGISENPLLGLRLKNAKPGDKITVNWSDNKGQSGSLEGVVQP
jgi:sulfur-oxidizing protein SoxZ